jgi:DNA-binding winged helix-turn-helix (wHTH) protein
MLLEKPGDLVTREEIRTILWPQSTFIDFDHSLNAAVRRLREALDDNADTPRFVETLPRRGYRFVAPVEAISTEGVGSEEGSASKAVVLAGEATQYAANPGEDVAPQKVSGRAATPLWKILALVAPVMAAFAIAAVVLSMRSSEAVNSIAVLPFANATGDASLLYLSDGIAESVVNNLSQVPGLKVTELGLPLSAARSKAKSRNKRTRSRSSTNGCRSATRRRGTGLSRTGGR